MRLRHDQDYDKALEILRNIGLPIKNAPQTTTIASTTAVPASNSSGLSMQPRPNILAQAPSTSVLQMPNLYTAQLQSSSPKYSATSLSSEFMPNEVDRSRSASSETLRPSSVVSQLWSHPKSIVRPFSANSSGSTSAIPSSASRATPMPNLYAAQVTGSNAASLSSLSILKDAGAPRPASSASLRPDNDVSQVWPRPDNIVRPFSATPAESTSAISTSASTPMDESLAGVSDSSLYVAQMFRNTSDTNSPATLHEELAQGRKPQLYDSQVPYQVSSICLYLRILK